MQTVEWKGRGGVKKVEGIRGASAVSGWVNWLGRGVIKDTQEFGGGSYGWRHVNFKVPRGDVGMKMSISLLEL